MHVSESGETNLVRYSRGTRGTAPVWVHLFFHDAEGKNLGEAAANPDQPISLSTPVLPGEYFVELRQYYDSKASVLPYVVRTRLDRVAPMETVPLADDPVRRIQLGEIVPVAIEQNGDHDHFRFSVPKKGPLFLRMHPTVWMGWTLIEEGSGKKITTGNVSGHQEKSWQLSAEGPMQCRLDIKEYYDNKSSLDPGWFIVDRKDRPLAGGRLQVKVDPADPTLARFELIPMEGLPLPAQAQLDADGDGTVDVALPPGRPVTWRYAKPGLYAARVQFTAADGAPGTAFGWSNAIFACPHTSTSFPRMEP